MTIDELRAEAKKRGFKLEKIGDNESLLPCVCGENVMPEWHHSTKIGYCLVCPECGLKSDRKRMMQSAVKSWNKIVKEKEIEYDSRRIKNRSEEAGL